MLHLKISGSARERGLAHGETLRKEIQELNSIRIGLFRKYTETLHPLKAEGIVHSQIEFLRGHLEYFDEFCGIALGAGITLGDLMILNNYTDLRDFGYVPTEAVKDKVDRLDGCSLFSYRQHGKNICGQTWDMHASARPYILHLEAEKTHLLTVAGCLGLAGINPQGPAVFINNMHCSETSLRLAWPILVRSLLNAPTASKAATFLKSNIPCSGHNYLICDANETLNVEATGSRTAVTDHLKGDGVCYHTNHFLDPQLAKTEILERQSPSTLKRRERLGKYFENKKDEPLDMQRLATDILGGGEIEGINIPATPNDPHRAMTCGGLIIDLAERKGQIFAGNYSENDRQEFTF